VIADNLSAHKSRPVTDFLVVHPKVHLHFTPTYSSWLNQVELWFGKIERDVIARGVFTSVSDLKRKLLRYIRQYNKSPRTVKWKYARSIAPYQYTISWYRPLLYRGFLLRYFQNWPNSWLAVVVVTILFAVGHAYQGRNGALTAGVLGAVFGVLAVLTGSLILSMILHVLVNLHRAHAVEKAMTTPAPA
jgi:hypothetical protein